LSEFVEVLYSELHPFKIQMTLNIHWHSTSEEIVDVIRVNAGFAVLEVYFSGRVIRKTRWQGQQNLSHQVDSWISVRPIIEYLQNPDKTALTVKLKKQGSLFSNLVWAELCKIPFAETITYSELADRVNSGARAVANACRNNPFPGFIPCHRVVSKSGIGGFMGQKEGESVEIKRHLLTYEVMIKTKS